MSFAAMVSFFGCSSNNEALDAMPESEKTRLKEFEEGFVADRAVNTRSAGPDAIQLLGCTSVEYFGDDAAVTKGVWEEYAQEIADSGCTFASFDGTFLRVYYPLINAAVMYKNKTYVADRNGVVVIEGVKNLSDIKVVGRKASDTVVPSSSAFLNDGNIMLASKLSTKNIYNEQRTLVFDLGYREQDCCKTKQPSAVRTRNEYGGGGNVSCTQNHGHYDNCTVAFPSVATGRCVTKFDRCMDYNGYGTDCQGSKLYFTGSDCFWAISQGECWNEINMRW